MSAGTCAPADPSRDRVFSISGADRARTQNENEEDKIKIERERKRERGARELILHRLLRNLLLVETSLGPRLPRDRVSGTGFSYRQLCAPAGGKTDTRSGTLLFAANVELSRPLSPLIS